MLKKIKSLLSDDGAGDLITSKTVFGSVGVVACVVANGYGLIEGDNFLMLLALFIGIAGYGFRNALHKIVIALQRLAVLMPTIEEHLGRNSQPANGKKESMMNSKTIVGVVGVVVSILCEVFDMLPGDSFKMTLAFSGGLAAIGGRMAIQRILVILTRIIALIPTIEAAIDLSAKQGELRDPNGLKRGEVQVGNIIFEPTENDKQNDNSTEGTSK